MSKEEQARREGMAYALRFAREKGLDALEADLKMRNAIDLPLRVSKADLDKFSDNVKYNTVLYVKILMAVTMHDEFGFGNKRIKQMVYDGLSTSKVSLTVQYKFNTTRSKYKGTGAGESQKNRM